MSNVAINTPNDDALVLKSSYALGVLRATENVTITNSVFSGYDLGTMLDGTYGTTMTVAPDKDGPNGRIKFGTESNGGSGTSRSRTSRSCGRAGSPSSPWTAGRWRMS